MIGKGKWTKKWEYERRKLKKLYQEKGITSCEIMFSGCMGNNFLSFAHKKKRVNYRSNPEGIGAFDETVLACINCHRKIEHNKQLTKEIFERLR